MGDRFVSLWRRTGDLIRDMDALFRAHGMEYTEETIDVGQTIRLDVATRSDTVR